MLRNLVIFTLATVTLCGCAINKEPTPVATDSVDALIAQNAVAATSALRELSQTTGNSRVATVQSPNDQEGKLAAYSAPKPLKKAPPQTIAERSSSLAADTAPSAESQSSADQSRPQPRQQTANPTTGGLLSAIPPGLEKTATVHWVGELEQLLAKLAMEAGGGWKIGDSSGVLIAPVVISVNAGNKPLYEILQDIGAIIGTSAEIRVSVATKTISVRYPIR